MISKYSKIAIPFIVVLSLVVIAKFYREYKDIQDLKMMIAENESATIGHLMQAFRQAYQKAFSLHQIPIDEKTIELLPVRTLSQISKNFSLLMDNKISIRTISQNPTNFSHLAKPEEKKYFDYFLKNSKEESWLNLYKSKGYLIAEPIYIKENCLKCHGKKETVLAIMQSKYSSGFNYKVGDIIGIQLIQYEQNNFIKKLDSIFVRNITMAFIVFVSVFIAIFWMLRLIAKKENTYRLSLEQHNKKLTKLTITDHLTGLNNRTYYAQIVEKEVNRARRDQRILVFAMLDLDCFKKFNDTYGHHEGDKLLQLIGGILKNTFNRANDYIFRIGGEEFLAMYYAENITEVSSMAELARKEIEKIQIEHIENIPYKIATTSIGLSVYQSEIDTSSNTLYMNADKALYRAKENGRNQVCVYKD